MKVYLRVPIPYLIFLNFSLDRGLCSKMRNTAISQFFDIWLSEFFGGHPIVPLWPCFNWNKFMLSFSWRSVIPLKSFRAVYKQKWEKNQQRKTNFGFRIRRQFHQSLSHQLCPILISKAVILSNSSVTAGNPNEGRLFCIISKTKSSSSEQKSYQINANSIVACFYMCIYIFIFWDLYLYAIEVHWNNMITLK